MPEVPEVQALAEFLRERLAGASVVSAELASIAVLKTYDPPLSALVDGRVRSVTRRGKFLVLEVESAATGNLVYVVIHFALAGWAKWRETIPAKAARPGRGPLMLRMAFAGQDGDVVGSLDLTEAGTKHSTSLSVVTDALDVPGIARLGPEVLSPDSGEMVIPPEDFATVLHDADRSQIKGVLRDQKRLAGIGNAYSDDILHRARLSPFRPSAGLDDTEVAALYEAVAEVLTEALRRARGKPPERLKDNKRSGLVVHGRKGEVCPICGDTIAEVSFAERALQYCPTCQTGGKPLADRRMSRLMR